MSPLGLTPTRRDAAGSLLGAQVPLREVQEGVWGPPSMDQCSLSPRTHLITQAELGDPRAGEGSCGKLRLGAPRGWGGTPAVSPRGGGSRERQEGPPSGKQESPGRGTGKTTRPGPRAAESPRGGQGSRPGQRGAPCCRRQAGHLAHRDRAPESRPVGGKAKGWGDRGSPGPLGMASPPHGSPRGLRAG